MRHSRVSLRAVDSAQNRHFDAQRFFYSPEEAKPLALAREMLYKEIYNVLGLCLTCLWLWHTSISMNWVI